MVDLILESFVDELVVVFSHLSSNGCQDVLSCIISTLGLS